VSSRGSFAERFITTYQRQVSHRLGTRCRFEPSCSEYALQAFGQLGRGRAIWLTSRRLVRCRGPVLDPLRSDPLP
jgi:putative membrane protein insertion efficiency factor